MKNNNFKRTRKNLENKVRGGYVNAEDEIQKTYGNQYVPLETVRKIYRKYGK